MRGQHSASVLPGPSRDMAALNVQGAWQAMPGSRYAPATIWIACALTLVVAVRLHELVGILAKIRPAMLTSAVGLAYILSTTSPEIWRAAFREPLLRLFLAFYGWAIVTVPFALFKGLAFNAATTPAFTQFALILAPLLSFPSRANLLWLQRFTVHGMTAHIAALLVLGETTKGRLGAESSGLDSNDYAAMAAIACCLGLGLVQREAKGMWRTMAMGSATLLALAVVKTGSRGGALALLVGAIVFLLASRGSRRFLYIALFPLAGSGIWMVAPPEFKQRMVDLAEGKEDYNYTEFSGRKAVWARARVYIARNPITGVGIANFPIMDGEFIKEIGRSGKWSAAHNSYYQSTAELGIPGGLLFILMLLLAAHRGWRLRTGFRHPTTGRTEDSPEYVAAICAFATSGLFLSHAYFYFLYGLLGLIAYAWRVSQAEAAAFAAAGGGSPAPWAPPVPIAPTGFEAAAGRNVVPHGGGWRTRASARVKARRNGQ